MKYFLVNDGSDTIRIYFEEPEDSRTRCYGFENFVSIPTKYSGMHGILCCGAEMKEIISSYYFNGILPCTGKQNGDIITPIECNKNAYLNKVIDAIKKNNEEVLTYLTRFYSSPCYNNVGIKDKRLDKIVDYLMYLYRSDMSRGSVILASIKYTENGEVLNGSNFNSLKNSEILNMVEYCIDNKVHIETFISIISMMEEGTFNEFKNILDEINSNIDDSIPKYLSIFLLKNTSKKNIGSTLNNLKKSSDDKIIEMIRSKKDVPGFYDLLNHLSEFYPVVQRYINEKLQILNGNAHFVDDVNAKYYDGCYYRAIEVNENILSELEKDEMLPLFITSGKFGRGPCLSKEYENKKLLYMSYFDSYIDEIINDIMYKEKD